MTWQDRVLHRPIMLSAAVALGLFRLCFVHSWIPVHLRLPLPGFEVHCCVDYSTGFLLETVAVLSKCNAVGEVCTFNLFYLNQVTMNHRLCYVPRSALTVASCGSDSCGGDSCDFSPHLSTERTEL